MPELFKNIKDAFLVYSSATPPLQRLLLGFSLILIGLLLFVVPDIFLAYGVNLGRKSAFFEVYGFLCQGFGLAILFIEMFFERPKQQNEEADNKRTAEAEAQKSKE